MNAHGPIRKSSAMILSLVLAVSIGPNGAIAGKRIRGDLSWGTGGTLHMDQGGSIELGDSLTTNASPYIDFHYGVGTNQDLSVRLINDGDERLTLISPNGVLLDVIGNIATRTSLQRGLELRWTEDTPYIDFTHSANPGRDFDYRVSAVNSDDPRLVFRSDIADNAIVIRRNGFVGIGWPVPGAELDVNGTTVTRVLRITGGADLAEHLNVTDTKPTDEFKIAPGMVVSIDPSGNRQFKLSDEPYDRKRVGIISGGNGVKSGLVLRQEGNPEADGDQPVALTGQVWCYADASFGAIEPGDLLTTSSTPGHAMKVTDFDRARFAVLGQALTGLKEGRGWVQVLVEKQ